MESPVRIIFDLAIVVHLLLGSSTVQSNAITSSIPPHFRTNVNAQSTSIDKINKTAWVKSTATDEYVMVGNDIIHQEEFDRVYSDDDIKDTLQTATRSRGRVKYTLQPSTTRMPVKRTTTKKAGVKIITPEPQTKNISQIINSMRKYKNSVSSSSTSPSEDKYLLHVSAESFAGDGENDNFSFDTIFNSSENPSDIDLIEYSKHHNRGNPLKNSSRSKTKGKHFTSSFNKNFDELILTTPKNDFFDKKYSAITKSITDNIDKHITENSKTSSKHKPATGELNFTKSTEDFLNKKPSKNSEMYFHKSKSILVTDNDAEGSSLSDVQGTSIYYEQSMLSTASYGDVPTIATDSDCSDDGTKDFIPISTERAKLIPRSTTTSSVITKALDNKHPKSEVTLNVSSRNYPRNYIRKRIELTANKSAIKINTNNQLSTTTSHTTPKERIISDFTEGNSEQTITFSDLNMLPTKSLPLHIVQSTDTIKKEDVFVHTSDGTMNTIPNPIRRIQFSLPGEMHNFKNSVTEATGASDGTLNSVLKSLEDSTLQTIDPILRTKEDPFTLNTGETILPTQPLSNVSVKSSRRIQYTTSIPKTRHRISVRKNADEGNPKPFYPTTIYAEHFNIKNKTQRAPEKNKTLLTTVSSAIDPVYEPGISGAKKIVHSHVISDNSIPSLRKRGSTRYGGVSTLVQASSEDALTIPTASSSWGALAGMRNPPSLLGTAANATTVKNVDENELQRVTDATEKQAFYPATTYRNSIALSTSTKPSTSEWKPLYISLQENAASTPVPSQNAEVIDIITARPIDSPPTTETVLTNELTGGTKFDTAAKSYNTRGATGWSPVNSTDINKIETQNKEEKSTLVGMSSNPNENKNMVKFSASSRTEGSQTTSKFPLNTTTPKVVTNPVQEPTEFPVFLSSAFVEMTRKPNILRIIPVKKTTGPDPIITNLQAVTIRTTPTTQNSLSSEPLDSITSETLASTTTLESIKSETLLTTSSAPLEKTSPKSVTVATPVTITMSPSPSITNDEEITTLSTGWHKAMIPTNLSTAEFLSTKLTNDLPVTTYRPIYVGSNETTEIHTKTVVTTENEPTTIATTTRGESAIQTIVNKNYTVDAIAETEQSEITEITSVEPISRTSTEYTVESTTSEADETTVFPLSAVNVVAVDDQAFKKKPQLENTTPIVESETTITTTLPEENSTDISPSLEEPKRTDIPSFALDLEHTQITSTAETLPTEALPTTEDSKSTDNTTAAEMKPTDDMTTFKDMTTEVITQSNTESRLEDLTSNFVDNLTTHSPNTGSIAEENSSAAGVAIAFSTIGVIALLLVIGLLLVLRRRRLRGRRCGVYAQRCTPVSLDAYSLDSVNVRRKGSRLRASKRSYGNPAYDDEVVISHPMQYAALANFVLNGESMAAEFSEIPPVSVRADEVPPGCEDKNRFSNILPMPETRVPLHRIDNDATSEYINANYVTGPGNIKNYYIACQAPMANTVNDFWRMIWEQNSRVIVMLTEYMENGAERCYEYLPPSEVTDNKRTFGDYQIILKRREQYDKYAVSSVQLKNLSSKTWREVTHLWYFWPAKGVPDDYESVINFMSEMRSHMKISQNAKEFDEDDAAIVEDGSTSNLTKLQSDGSPGSARGVHVYSPQKAEENMRKGVSNGNNGTLGRIKAAAELEGVRPCVVMCASGAGRTGALLALDICARAMEGSGTVDVPRTVRALRAARPHALQNKNQYIFLYKVLSEYGHKLHGGVDSI